LKARLCTLTYFSKYNLQNALNSYDDQLIEKLIYCHTNNFNKIKCFTTFVHA